MSAILLDVAFKAVRAGGAGATIFAVAAAFAENTTRMEGFGIAGESDRLMPSGTHATRAGPDWSKWAVPAALVFDHRIAMSFW
jgi:5-enolpyruvylshikimate-3-phosphate synthase